MGSWGDLRRKGAQHWFESEMQVAILTAAKVKGVTECVENLVRGEPYGCWARF
jgi:hypothetical protein